MSELYIWQWLNCHTCSCCNYKSRYNPGF